MSNANIEKSAYIKAEDRPTGIFRYRFNTFDQFEMYNKWLYSKDKIDVCSVTLSRSVVKRLAEINKTNNRPVTQSRKEPLEGHIAEKQFQWKMVIIDVGYVQDKTTGKMILIILDGGGRITVIDDYMQKKNKKEVSLVFRFNCPEAFRAYYDQHSNRKASAHIQMGAHLEPEPQINNDNLHEYDFHTLWPADSYGELSHKVLKGIQNGFNKSSVNHQLIDLAKNTKFSNTNEVGERIKSDLWISELKKPSSPEITAVFATFEIRRKLFFENKKAFLTGSNSPERKYLKNAICQALWYHNVMRLQKKDHKCIRLHKFINSICNYTEEEMKDPGTVEHALHSFMTSIDMFWHIVNKWYVTKQKVSKPAGNWESYIKEKYYYDVIMDHLEGKQINLTTFKDVYYTTRANAKPIVPLGDYQDIEQQVFEELGMTYTEFEVTWPHQSLEDVMA